MLLSQLTRLSSAGVKHATSRAAVGVEVALPHVQVELRQLALLYRRTLLLLGLRCRLGGWAVSGRCCL